MVLYRHPVPRNASLDGPSCIFPGREVLIRHQTAVGGADTAPWVLRRGSCAA